MASTIAELQAKAKADAAKIQNATYLKTQLTRATDYIQVRQHFIGTAWQQPAHCGPSMHAASPSTTLRWHLRSALRSLASHRTHSQI